MYIIFLLRTRRNCLVKSIATFCFFLIDWSQGQKFGFTWRKKLVIYLLLVYACVQALVSFLFPHLEFGCLQMIKYSVVREQAGA